MNFSTVEEKASVSPISRNEASRKGAHLLCSEETSRATRKARSTAAPQKSAPTTKPWHGPRPCRASQFPNQWRAKRKMCHLRYLKCQSLDWLDMTDQFKRWSFLVRFYLCYSGSWDDTPEDDMYLALGQKSKLSVLDDNWCTIFLHFDLRAFTVWKWILLANPWY